MQNESNDNLVNLMNTSNGCVFFIHTQSKIKFPSLPSSCKRKKSNKIIFILEWYLVFEMEKRKLISRKLVDLMYEKLNNTIQHICYVVRSIHIVYTVCVISYCCTQKSSEKKKKKKQQRTRIVHDIMRFKVLSSSAHILIHKKQVLHTHTVITSTATYAYVDNGVQLVQLICPVCNSIIQRFFS